MSDRRVFLKQLGACTATLAAAAAVPAYARTAARPGAWPLYRDTLAIDGASGLMLAYLEDDAPATARELQAARDCGLAATLLTVAPSGRFWLDDAAFERTRASILQWQRLIARYPERLAAIRTHADLVDAHATGRLGMIFGFQGTEPLGEDLERIPMFRDMGVRVVQLTHNRRNLVGDGCMEPGNAGLSHHGHAVVERLNAERVLVDLSHGAQRTIREGIQASKAPVLISHTGCRALADLPRNTGDAELRAMADRGGVAGIIFWPYLRTDTQPMAADVVRHLEHAIDVCGEDHVGIGTDTPVAPVARTPAFERDNRAFMRGMKEDGIFASDRPDDMYTFIPDLNTADRFDTLAALLSRRGHADARIAKILGGNFARVMREVWSAAPA
ncbi:dipeptidase [Marilutibacter spongiae]|uniref:Membrane dipeptidase n=1 Tax=Marilutibacter spongiae TaxID=2025720 RepID=A0A7W3TM23_9GAMM|nr:membrane dipeptidase [Lysobacter spongiae]MBB1060788.1 membrane dipeptidase [Lysobacter spongiae]